MDSRTLIVAANGRIASGVAATLSSTGEAPDVLVRDAAKARQVLVDEHGRPTYRELFLGELADVFRPTEPWLSVEPRGTVDEDGNEISEWRTTIDEVRAFLSAHP